RNIGINYTHTPDQVSKADDERRCEKQTQGRMREGAVVHKSIYGAFDKTDDIEVGSVRSERHGCRSQCRLAIESGAGENSASQEMRERFQIKLLTHSKLL